MFILFCTLKNLPGELAAFIESIPESLLKVVQMEAVASLALLAWPDMALRTSSAEGGDWQDDDGLRSSIDFNSGKKTFLKEVKEMEMAFILIR